MHPGEERERELSSFSSHPPPSQAIEARADGLGQLESATLYSSHLQSELQSARSTAARLREDNMTLRVHMGGLSTAGGSGMTGGVYRGGTATPGGMYSSGTGAGEMPPSARPLMRGERRGQGQSWRLSWGAVYLGKAVSFGLWSAYLIHCTEIPEYVTLPLDLPLPYRAAQYPSPPAPPPPPPLPPPPFPSDGAQYLIIGSPRPQPAGGRGISPPPASRAQRPPTSPTTYTRQPPHGLAGVPARDAAAAAKVWQEADHHLGESQRPKSPVMEK